MSGRNLELREALANLQGEPDALAQLGKVRSSDELLSLLMTFLGERGLQVERAELLGLLEQRSLDDEGLAAVSGGVEVNSRITDSVAQTNVKVIGDAPAMAYAPIYYQNLFLGMQR